jgi:hypothetical protein
MKTSRLVFFAGLLGSLSLGAMRTDAYHEVSASIEIRAEADFYQPLGDYGTWVEVAPYGRCWHPVAIDDPDAWRPYCDGHWEWTDCGWYWVSDEPWAWACYHYGRWVYHPRHAWIWVPATEWGPAWVCWREGGGYVGWAPLPPSVGFHGEIIRAEHVRIQPSLFVFVGVGHFHERVQPRRVIVNNTTIINKTVNITNIRRVEKTIINEGPRKVVVNEGPRIEAIQKATGQEVRTRPLPEIVRQTPVPQSIQRKAAIQKPSQQLSPAQEQPRVNAPPQRRQIEPPVAAPSPPRPQSPPPETVRPAPEQPRQAEPPPDKVKKHPKAKGQEDEDKTRERKQKDDGQ